MKKISITSPKWEGEFILQYHDNGLLAQANMPEVFNMEALLWFAEHYPVTEEILEHVKNCSKAKFTEVIEIEFAHFWAKYKRKEGSKDIAEQYWNGLKKTCTKRPITTEDRMQIMQVLPRFMASVETIYLPLPTTFLHGRRWIALYENMVKDNKNKPYQNNLCKELLDKWTKK